MTSHASRVRNEVLIHSDANLYHAKYPYLDHCALYSFLLDTLYSCLASFCLIIDGIKGIRLRIPQNSLKLQYISLHIRYVVFL